jgi:pimeloyl-ACP methyl ester carboxylesterase
MPYQNLNGSKFFYRQAGRGPDVVLIHGLTGNLAVWIFMNTLERLATQFRVTAYDLRGHGGSAVTPTGYTSRHMADDLLALHTALGLGPAYLVGHSFGGAIAMHFAALHPERVAGVILADTYFPGLSHLEGQLGQTNVWQDVLERCERYGIPIGADFDFTRVLKAVEDITPEQMERIAAELGPATPRWLAHLPVLAQTTCGVEAFEVAGLTPELICSVAAPVVALYDEESPFFATSRFLTANLPHCSADQVPGARHLAPLQAPQGFIELVEKHLQRMACRPPLQ